MVVGEGARVGVGAVLCGGVSAGAGAGECVEDGGGVWTGGRLAAVDVGREPWRWR
jgi:hypothetical protein